MELKHKTKTFFVVEYYDLDKFIREQFNLKPDDYDFCSSHEGCNDNVYAIKVTGKLESWEKDELANFKKDPTQNSFWKTPVLLNDLASRKVIPTGNYLIRIYY
jgi:hypothetical protein